MNIDRNLVSYSAQVKNMCKNLANIVSGTNALNKCLDIVLQYKYDTRLFNDDTIHSKLLAIRDNMTILLDALSHAQNSYANYPAHLQDVRIDKKINSVTQDLKICDKRLNDLLAEFNE